MSQRIVVLDGYALNPGDLTWDAFRELGEVEVHDRTPADQVVSRGVKATAVLTNKTPLRSADLEQLSDLRYIGVLATGYDVVDVKAARERGVAVTNVPTYGTDSVAQFAFALILELCHRVQRHADDAASGGWAGNPDWSYHVSPLVELAGKTLGLVGFGRIGRQTAAIGRAFGMTTIAHDVAATGRVEDTEMVDLDELLRRSDAVSLHCPLTADNRGMINSARISLMKTSALLINTARGPLVVEQDLADALNAGKLGGAGLDVLPVEPPRNGSPLFGAKNCIVTPHIAWATREARARLMDIAVENLRAFLNGQPRNVVNAT
jgi:glycerate dehydrogenase